VGPVNMGMGDRVRVQFPVWYIFSKYVTSHPGELRVTDILSRIVTELSQIISQILDTLHFRATLWGA